jgi:class 3 adenylate cyclase
MRPADRDGVTSPDAAPDLDLEKVGRMLLDAAGVGLAVADPRTREIRLANPRMRAWFGIGDAPVRLEELLPELDPRKLEARLAAGREVSLEVEARVGRRRIALEVSIARSARDGFEALMVECRNVSRLRELEAMLDSYSAMVERRNRELAAAKDRVERVLLNIMPKTVYEEWRRFGVTAPRLYENATILMLDFVGFTEMAVTQDPPELIRELNDLFTAFDRIVEQFGCERLKTIGDAYMAVSGLPLETPDHAANAAGVALRIRHFLEMRNRSHPHRWLCRIGIHTGPVVGSIVGVQKYVYDVFGPGVNLAARLEALAEPMEILISVETRARLDGRFGAEAAGLRSLRGAGEVEVHRLLSCEALEAH